MRRADASERVVCGSDSLDAEVSQRRNRYTYAGVLVESGFPLPDLPAFELGSASGEAIAVGLLNVQPPEPGGGDWLHHWRAADGEVALSLARSPEGGFLLRFPDQADFLLSAAGDNVRIWPRTDTGPETVRHLLLDQVLPRLLAQQRRLVLHAGVVQVGEFAIAFLGKTGRGKSTLVASFDSAGCPLLSDDGLAVKKPGAQVLVTPTYPSLRLWPETVSRLFGSSSRVAAMAHYSSKQRVMIGDLSAAVVRDIPLGALFVLQAAVEAEPDATSVSRLPARDACMALIENSFQLDVTDGQRAKGLLTIAGDIALRVPVFSISYPRNFARLNDVRAAILGQRSSWES